MSNDPLALSAVMAGPPHEAEYDAVYAAVTATERGRWFLAEYANRNRHADTNLVVAAMARIEAAVRGDAVPQGSATVWRDLTGVAATIAQTREAMTAEATPDIGAAMERIQDISFSLRERSVDAALCDDLDAAVRLIADAYQAQASGKASTAELLRAVADRVDRLIKPAGDGPMSASGENKSSSALAESEPSLPPVLAAEEPPAVSLVAVDFPASNEATEAAATLNMSLTDSAPAADLRAALDVAIAPPAADNKASREQAAAQADDGPLWHIEGPDFFFGLADAKPANEPPPSDEAERFQSLLPEPRLQSEPEDDAPTSAAETAEPASPSLAVMPAAVIATSDEDDVTPADTSPLPTANGSAMRAVSRMLPSNRLVTLRGLSEDDLNALFG
jgi:hypothetical protein